MANKKANDKTHGMPLTGYFYSKKLVREVWYPSSIAADLLYFLEYLNHVVWYSEKVDKITWETDDGTIHTYTPDYIIHLTDGAKIIVECKPEEKIDDEEVLQQRAIGNAWAQVNNHSFILIHQNEMRAGFILRNLVYLYRYAHTHVPVPKLQQILSELRSSGGKLAIWELSERCKSENEGKLASLPYIINSIFSHLINVDLTQKITNDSLIWIPSEDEPFSISTVI